MEYLLFFPDFITLVNFITSYKFVLCSNFFIIFTLYLIVYLYLMELIICICTKYSIYILVLPIHFYIVHTNSTHILHIIPTINILLYVEYLLIRHPAGGGGEKRKKREKRKGCFPLK